MCLAQGHNGSDAQSELSTLGLQPCSNPLITTPVPLPHPQVMLMKLMVGPS